MVMHSVHPSISEVGLVDGCPRCVQLGAYPHGLDWENGQELLRRYRAGEEPRSVAEAAAFATCRVEQWQEVAAHFEHRMLEARDAGDADGAERQAEGLAGAIRMVKDAKRARLDAIWAMAECEERADWSPVEAGEVDDDDDDDDDGVLAERAAEAAAEIFYTFGPRFFDEGAQS